jgi:hypothetical protein
MGTLKPARHTAEMPRRTGLLAIALVGALLAAGAPARAADEPVATATIPPPPPAAAPMVVPLPQRAAPAPSKTAAPKTARPAERERKPAVTADRRKPASRNAADAKKRAEREKARASAPARRPERQQATAAKREQPRVRAEYRPRRYYYREYQVEPPYPPPWYDRGPPFAAMPYPRGMMPPW